MKKKFNKFWYPAALIFCIINIIVLKTSLHDLTYYSESSSDKTKCNLSIFNNIVEKAENRKYSEEELAQELRTIHSQNISIKDFQSITPPQIDLGYSSCSHDSISIIHNLILYIIESAKNNFINGITKINWYKFICSAISKIELNDLPGDITMKIVDSTVTINPRKVFTLESNGFNANDYLTMVLIHEAGHNYYNKYLTKRTNIEKNVPEVFYFISSILISDAAEQIEDYLMIYNERLVKERTANYFSVIYLDELSNKNETYYKKYYNELGKYTAQISFIVDEVPKAIYYRLVTITLLLAAIICTSIILLKKGFQIIIKL
jgi:hypothetical protein